MSDSTTPHPWMTSLTLRRFATEGAHPWHCHGFRASASPGLVRAAPTGTALAESII